MEWFSFLFFQFTEFCHSLEVVLVEVVVEGVEVALAEVGVVRPGVGFSQVAVTAVQIWESKRDYVHAPETSNCWNQ